jgi:hypothetical protein
MPCCRADGWICEKLPDRPWPHDHYAGPGMLCRNPECIVGRVKRAELDSLRESEQIKTRSD